MKIISKKNCECCKSAYVGGKQYGEYQCVIPWVGVEFKGLCESCNPTEGNVWYNPSLYCHKKV